MEAGLQQTPSADRIHIAFFGRRNAGKYIRRLYYRIYCSIRMGLI